MAPAPPHVRVVSGLRVVGPALALGGRAHGARALLGEGHRALRAPRSERRSGRRERRSGRLGEPSRRRHDLSLDPKKLSDPLARPAGLEPATRLRRPLLYPTELRARAMHKLR